MGLAERLTEAEKTALRLLEEELDAQRETELRELRAERFGAPCAPFLEVRCHACGGTLIPNAAGFHVHQGYPNCSTPTISIEEVKR